MPRRCKLISPTNLMLEHPIVSPVDECEYFLVGVKEYARAIKHTFTNGILVGAVLGLVLSALIVGVAEKFSPCR